jgi:hypothetical protein
MKQFTIALFATGLAAIMNADAADIELVKDGKPNAAIYVAPEVMAPDKAPTQKFAVQEAETQRQRLRESVKDLALYIEKMSGAKIEVLTTTPDKADPRLPILIGDLAEKQFGPPKKKAGYKQGFRVVVSSKGVGLIGESDLATSYAIYEVLERLGCRWYMPSEIGEVIPSKKTIALPAGDDSLVPATLYRGIWYADDAFRRRNRFGGLLLSAGHALEIAGYVSKEQLAAHPDWQGLVKGKRSTHRLCWANAEAAAAVADGIIAQLDQNYTPTVSLSPDDGAEFCECDKCKALDAGDMDPSMGQVSITDRYIHFCNLIAERVTKKYPDVLFGFLAYVQYTRPPVREKVHPSLVPQIAPITYCRAHTFLQNNCPSRPVIKPIVEGWGKRAKHVSYYNYMFHLAEVAVPYPMMKQMSDELPVLYANGVDLWQPETMPNFESVLPGMVLTIRMSWNTKAKPADVLDEFFTKFYGAAAVPMRKYWQLFDEAWTMVPEHAGCGFGYPKRFTPEFMKQARAAMNEALAACKTEAEKARVQMQDESFKQFELFMKLRWDLFDGRFATMEQDSTRYVETQKALGEKYAPQAAFSKVGWTANTVGGQYFKIFFEPAYLDAARIAKSFAFVQPPLRQWRYAVDKEKKGESLGWHKADFDDKAWKTTDPCVDTWFALGLDTYYGPMFYRANVKLPAVPAGKKTFLWISSTDGSAKVFVNGQHVPYVNEKGEKADEFTGFCQTASFDITAAAKPGDENQITIIGTHTFLNELGAGGLLGPVAIYHEKP